MSGKLSGDVSRFLATNVDLTPPERLVLLLIAERANETTRLAYAGGQEEWALGPRVGLSARRLQEVLARLAERGLEVRVARGKDSLGRPVFGAWNRQTTYQVPDLGCGIPHPRSNARGAESRALSGRGNALPRVRDSVVQGAESGGLGRGNALPRVRDSAPLSLKVPQDRQVPEEPSSALARDDNADASSRPVLEDEDALTPAVLGSDNTAVRQLRAQLAGQRSAKVSRWNQRVAEPNPLFDPAVQGRLLEEAHQLHTEAPATQGDPAA